VKYHSRVVRVLTVRHELGTGPCQGGGLTGAVASQRVTEAPNGSLRVDGNHPWRAKADGSLTARRTGRAGTKVGLSDPLAPRGRARA
jgi:hypothetical protein